MSEAIPEFGKTDAFFEPQTVRSQVVLTRKFWILVAVGIPLIGIANMISMGWLLYVYNGFLVLAALISFALGPNSKNLFFRRRMDAVLSVRARNRIRIELEFDGINDLSGEIRDEIPATFEGFSVQSKFKMKSGSKFSHDYFTVPPDRGDEYFRATFLRLNCPLGLIQKQIQLNTEQPIKVYPNILALREFNLLNQKGRLREAGVRKSRLRGMGTEFESLRDYALGDDFRKIDWKATARRGKVIVREFEIEKNQAVMICIDCGRHMLAEVGGIRKLDLVLDSVLMLIQSALLAGDNVGLMAYGADVIKYIPAKKGQRQMGILLNAMHDLIAEPLESDPVRAFSYLSARHKKRSLLIHFTAMEERDRAREIIQSFGPMARGHISLLGIIGDPKFRELLRAKPDTSTKLFQFASAYYLTEESRQASAMLRSAGINILNSEPQELAADLVNFYLDVKSRGKL